MDENTNHDSAATTAPAEPKRKKKKSKSLKEPQRFERSASKAERRMARAVLVGLSTWNRRRDKSAGKRRDGALKDALVNTAHAAGKMAREAAKAPMDLIDGMNPRFDKKTEKRVVKTVRGLLG